MGGVALQEEGSSKKKKTETSFRKWLKPSYDKFGVDLKIIFP
jgi:hypothetical protein